MKKLTACFVITLLLSACQTLEERFAKRTGCDVKGVTVQKVRIVPAYQEHLVRCKKENKEYKCIDAPFTSTCSEVGAGEVNNKKKKKDKKKAELSL